MDNGVVSAKRHFINLCGENIDTVAMELNYSKMVAYVEFWWDAVHFPLKDIYLKTRIKSTPMLC